MERDKRGKFLSIECWEALELEAILERREVGWERALERLRVDMEKLKRSALRKKRRE